MSRYQIADLREQKYALNQQIIAKLDEISELRTSTDDVDKSENLTAEKRQELERMEADFAALNEDIAKREKYELEEKPTLEARHALAPAATEATLERRENAQADPEKFNLAMRALLQKGEAGLTDEQRTTLNVTTAADGGNTVPELWGDLIESLRESSPIRAEASVYSTTSGADLILPKVTAAATDPAIVAEEDAVAFDGEAFGQTVVKAFMYARGVKASEQMLTDASFPVEAFVARRLGFDLGLFTGKHLSVGTGTGSTGDTQPQGLFTGAPAVGSAIASLGYTNLIDLQHGVIGPYQPNAVWVAKDATIADLRKIVDTTGRPIYQVDMRVGAPDTLLGKRIVLDPNAPANAVSQSPVVYGDLKRGYLVRDVVGIKITRLNELFKGNLQVAWVGQIRTGGAITDAAAVRKLTRAAS